MIPFAPALFSTTAGFPIFSVMDLPRILAITSEDDPGDEGTTKVIGLLEFSAMGFAFD
jgi:hypothetical protein